MASLEDFINHRWADAKEALRQLDSNFVGTLENDIRFDKLGLTPPPRQETFRRPNQPLSSDWHRLLEVCYELTRQVDILKASVNCLTQDGSKGTSSIDIARQRDYHFRSWAIHAVTLCDHSDEVIRWSARVYLPPGGASDGLANSYKKSIDDEIRDRLKQIRNDYVHPANRSWSQAVTENDYWEGCVALGMTPRKHLDEFHYPAEANRASLGLYSEAVTETDKILGRLGSILYRLEADITVKNEACSTH